MVKEMKEYNIPLEEIRELSERINAQKGQFRSTRNLRKNNSSHYLGKIGEFIFCEEYKGLYPSLEVNMELLLQGDGSKDFSIDGRTIDIKTTSYWKEPLLKEFTSIKNLPDIYVLVSVKEIDEVNNKVIGEVNGACTGIYLIRKAPEKLSNLGLRYVIRVEELKEFSSLLL